MLGLAVFLLCFFVDVSIASVCTNSYGGYCTSSGGCPSGYGYTYTSCYYTNQMCCIPPTPQTTRAPTTTTTQAPFVGIHSCSVIYGGTCYSQSRGCPSNNAYTYSHCGQSEMCCIPYHNTKQTTRPTTHVTHSVASTSCSQNHNGYCIKLLSSGSCPSGYSYTYSYCGFLELCCIPPNRHGTTAAPFVSHVSTSRPAVVTSTCGTSLVGFTSHKIVGGTQSHHGEFPWQISLRYHNQHICGGALIDGQWVLTAAHCFEDSSLSTHVWTVGVGIHDMHSVHSSNIAHVSYISVHEHYNSRSNLNDIAILKLSKRLDTTGRYIRPACLPRSSDNFEGNVCTVSGWGDTKFYTDGGPGSRYLKSVSIGVLRQSLCRYYLGSAVHSSNICAGDTSRGGKDSCQGDSGGPLICKKNGVWELAGVVSWGYGCGEATSPGVYTKVSSFLSWINNKMASH